MWKLFFIKATLLLALGLGLLAYLHYGPVRWQDEERELIQSLSLYNLPPLPKSPSNAVADNPLAIKLGQQLFFDPQFSGNGKVSCATCHQPDKAFTDGLARAKGLGVIERNTMSLIGAAYSPWYFWDGRADSLWSQALGPLEHPDEHGSTRTTLIKNLARNEQYQVDFEKLFGPLPNLNDTLRFPDHASPLGTPDEQQRWNAMTADDQTAINMAFSRLGKVLAAYQRTLLPTTSRFDDFARELKQQGESTQLSQDEQKGLRIFLGKGQCINCHNGPLLTNFSFHNTGVLPAAGLPLSLGRVEGLSLLQQSEFNCFGQYNDDREDFCEELRFVATGQELVGAQRTPSLRTLTGTEPYMNSGQISDLTSVIEHYNQAKPAMVGHNEIKPLGLSATERQQLLAFLNSLSTQ